jgi:hypothetical protein
MQKSTTAGSTRSAKNMRAKGGSINSAAATQAGVVAGKVPAVVIQPRGLGPGHSSCHLRKDDIMTGFFYGLPLEYRLPGDVQHGQPRARRQGCQRAGQQPGYYCHEGGQAVARKINQPPLFAGMPGCSIASDCP